MVLPWKKRRFLRNVAAVLAFGAFIPAVPALAAEEELVDAQTNEFTSSYLELVDSFVTSERIPTDRLETPANVYVITAAEIEANHYQDIGEALSHVPGVFVSQYQAGGSPTPLGNVRINGDLRVLVLVDGHRLNAVGGTIFPAAKADITPIPSMKMIERIEVVKGGGSVFYGADALGGVINIITKKGSANETTVDLRAGSWHRRTYELANQGVADKFSWFVTGNIGESNAFKYGGSGVMNPDTSAYDDRAFSARLDQDFDDSSSLTANFMYRKFDNEIASVIFDKTDSVSLSYNFKEDTSTPGWIRYFRNNRKQNSNSIESHFQGVEYQNGWNFDKHKIIFGAEWHQSKDSSGFYGYDSSKTKNTEFYLQDTIALGDKWLAIPGVRLDHSSGFGSHWSPKLAANYRADDKTKIYASWGRFYRAPTNIETDVNTQATYIYSILNGLTPGSNAYYLIGDKNLQPETGHSEIIGFEHDFDENTALNMSLFNSKLKNGVLWTIFSGEDSDYLNALDNQMIDDWANTGASGIVAAARYLSGVRIARNANTEKRHGLDVTFSKKVNDNFGYDLGYTYVHRDTKDGEGNPQPHGYRFGLHYIDGPWKANFSGVMATGRDTNFYKSKNYAVLNLNGSYDITERATVYLLLNNLMNKDYEENANDSGLHSPGRFFMLGAQLKF